MPAAKQRVPSLLKLGKLTRVDDADVEGVGRLAVAAAAVRGDQGAKHLLVVGMDSVS